MPISALFNSSITLELNIQDKGSLSCTAPYSSSLRASKNLFEFFVYFVAPLFSLCVFLSKILEFLSDSFIHVPFIGGKLYLSHGVAKV